MNNKSKAEAILGLVREIDSLKNEKQLLQKQLDVAYFEWLCHHVLKMDWGRLC